MRNFDVFNGDADGICALHQIRLAEPAESELVTGVKRDIQLLERVSAGAGDLVTVLDISLDRNRSALLRLLYKGVRVRYFDHHAAHGIPDHPALEAVIDQSRDVCTSVLVDRYLGAKYRPWAVAAAFGDNLSDCAARLAAPLGLNASQLDVLRELGENLNYNAYGETKSDQLVPSADLYRVVHGYSDPYHLARSEPVIAQLGHERKADLRTALAIEPRRASFGSDAYLLPDAPWSRRVSGAFANQLASTEPERAHAVLTCNGRGGYTASVRSPGSANESALDFCLKFTTGGGRTQAAGIDHIEPAQIDTFLDEFERTFEIRRP
jgi:hypothetical protein